MPDQKIDNALIRKAATLLKAGGLVSFPTETVYGLGACARNEKALKKIFAAKNRPLDHPLIVHVYSDSELKDWISDMPAAAEKLAEKFWPGPLTMIFDANPAVSALITGGQKTVSVRMPSHPVARELLRQVGEGLAAPSANRFGCISPTNAQHVRQELGDKVDLIIDGGECAYGLESTIINAACFPPQLLRPGPLAIETLENITGIKIVEKSAKFPGDSLKNLPRVSGSLHSHYAPCTPLKLYSDGLYLKTLTVPQKNIGVMAFDHKPQNFSGAWITMPDNAFLYGKALYAVLRELDAKNLKTLYAQMPPPLPVWRAVCDRLTRAGSTL